MPGHCGTTQTGERGDCESGDKGSLLPVMQAAYKNKKKWHAAIAECMALCAQCARCEYVSISPRWNDCSWYHSCDLNRTLTNVQNILSGSYHTDKSSQRGTWHEQLGAVTSEGAARELITER